MDTVQLLRQVSIFAELPPETLVDLAKRVWHKPAEAGSVIVNQEEPGDQLFVIAGRTHQDSRGLRTDADFQRRLDGDLVDPVVFRRAIAERLNARGNRRFVGKAAHGTRPPDIGL